ncbi:receptor-type tyrosine-protein phosphatase mu-like isoform X2 [Pollicipes pollicipes]|uniref:receptor-type tyrosine-protein phosphatase mu-like isoform X2 n=1 Tax=Pollicipes pollicipes TaxID=41117 RepID=UPI0018851F1A|nr:receptor-type tyrosine-protein phosphatase mu-like isoform X2 [Pollicipes pollicipes]
MSANLCGCVRCPKGMPLAIRIAVQHGFTIVTSNKESNYGAHHVISISRLQHCRQPVLLSPSPVLDKPDVQVSDAGVYWLAYLTYRIYLSATRLIVRGCPANFFGDQCDKRCPHCLHGGQCHDVTGQCVCPPGFTGPRCETGCGRAHFGRTCLSSCHSNSCRRRLLCVPDPYGCSCAPGWSGTFCHRGCTRERYGPDCEFSCGKCKFGSCDRFTGQCDDGCADSNDLPPLCQQLFPWFRDPPQLVEVGYNRLVITHAPWSSEYDNGFGHGPYRYAAEYRRADTGGSWVSSRDGPVVGGRDPDGPQTIRFEIRNLEASTKYFARIIITDTTLGRSATNESKVPYVPATTDCAEPGEASDILIVDLTAVSVSVVVQSIANDETACPYRLNVTLQSASQSAAVPVHQLVEPGGRAEFNNLTPYSRYTVQVVAANRKGAGAVSTKTFQTNETAPSRVTKLETQLSDRGVLRITWGVPRQQNGVIRDYRVVVQHRRYFACQPPRADFKDAVDELTRTRAHVVHLKHAFSEYSISVAAVTVEEGLKTAETVQTARKPPSAPVRDFATTVGPTYIQLTWAWPSCDAWGDERSTLRLSVDTDGKSSWNQAFKQTDAFDSPTAARIERLIPYSNYTLKAIFVNGVGSHPQVDTKDVLTQEAAPGAPANLTVLSVSPEALIIGWEPPRPPFSRITGYRVSHSQRYRLATTEDYAPANACPSDSTAASACRAEVAGLQINTLYTITVYALRDRQLGQGVTIEARTREGVPGPPEQLEMTERTTTTLGVAWREPTKRNGRLLAFQLNVTLAPGHARRRRRESPFFLSIDVPARREGSRVGERDPYQWEVTDLRAGRTYRVAVAANTSAGFGEARAALMATQVAPPGIAEPPRVRTGRSTATTVELALPTADDTGGPVSTYFVVVSTDPAFNGSLLSPQLLPNVDDDSSDDLSFYVAAALTKERVNRDSTFIVGDGLYYNSSERHYHNRPLTAGTSYRMGVAVLSRLSDDNQELAFRLVDDAVTVAEPSDAGLVAGVIIALILLSLLAVVGVIVYRRRNKQHALPEDQQQNAVRMPLEPVLNGTYEGQGEVLDTDDVEEVVYENLQPGQINLTRIEVKNLPQLARSGDESGVFKAQMKSLPRGLVSPYECGRQTVNRGKNRYVNMIAYDESRVVLEKLEGDEHSDYINANYVDGYKRPRAYIATQGPRKETVFDFWRMIWQDKVRRIVMLTNLVEDGKRKCDLYWPESEPLQLPAMTIRRESETIFASYCIRTFSVAVGNNTRTVTQLHYTAWPDHSVPMYPDSLAKFVRAMDGVSDGQAPTVVHCSAGVGRTGTVILIDAMHQMGRREQAVDVCSHLAVMRRQRANLCANCQQYELVHQVLVQLLAAPDSAVPAAQLVERLVELRSRTDGGPSGLQRQLRFLDDTRPTATYAMAQAERLDGKNRTPDVLPADRSRVFLDPSMPDNYVNAVYVSGFKKEDAFIATEAPLPGRAVIFWQMVVQKRSKTIVVMNDLTEKDVFWPSPGETRIYRDLVVESEAVSETGLVVTVNIELKHFEGGKVAAKQSVQLLLLAGGNGTVSADHLVQLHDAFARIAAKHAAGPTVVVCRNGVSGCGLFVTVCFVLDHLSEEQEVDVVMAVSAVRKSRPQFITDLHQFELCHDVALQWLEAFATYANFK